MAGDLLPIRAELLFSLRAERVVGIWIALLPVRIDPASIPVDVDHAKHAGIEDPADDLVDPLELLWRDAAVVGKGIQCHRQANRLEAHTRKALNVVFRDGRTAPAGLPVDDVVKGIADVDAGRPAGAVRSEEHT